MENLKEFHYTATHDHPDDTELHFEYSNSDKTGKLTLLFHHEDEDCGTEEMFYNGEEASLMELVEELHDEIYEYLENVKRGGIYKKGIDVLEYYEGFTMSSLYAFNNICYDVMKKFKEGRKEGSSMTKIAVYDVDAEAIEKIADANDMTIAEVFESLMEYAMDMIRDNGME